MRKVLSLEFGQMATHTGVRSFARQANKKRQNDSLTVWSKRAKSRVDAYLKTLRRSPIARSWAREKKDEATLHGNSTMAEAPRSSRDATALRIEPTTAQVTDAQRFSGTLAQVHIDVPTKLRQVPANLRTEIRQETCETAGRLNIIAQVHVQFYVPIKFRTLQTTGRHSNLAQVHIDVLLKLSTEISEKIPGLLEASCGRKRTTPPSDSVDLALRGQSRPSAHGR